MSLSNRPVQWSQDEWPDQPLLQELYFSKCLFSICFSIPKNIVEVFFVNFLPLNASLIVVYTA